MADTIIDGTELNSAEIRYSSPKALGNLGGKVINVLNNNTRTALRVSTPVMLTWGASDYNGNEKFEMALQFPSEQYVTPDATEFLKNMQAFEETIKAAALTNSKDWFGKQHSSSEVVDALFSPMLKYPKNKITGEPDMSKAPLFRIKLKTWEGSWKVLICDEEGSKLYPNAVDTSITPLSYLTTGVHLATIIQCEGIWVMKSGKFGVTWKLVQAVVQQSKEASLLDECHIKLKPSDKKRLSSSIGSITTNDTVNVAQVEDSEEEEEEEEDEPEQESTPEPEPEPEPEPSKPKKKVIKKKVVATAS